MEPVVAFMAGTGFGGFVVLFVGNLLFNFFNSLEPIMGDDQTKE